jgi:hypothetical protein
MTTPVTPLAALAQRISQQEAELSRLRQEFEARQAQLAELTRRKKDLQTQLEQVETQLQVLGQSAGPAETPAPAGQPADGLSLPQLLVSILQKNPRSVPIKELVREVERRQYVTRSGNLRKLVENRVRDLVQKGVFRRTADRGVLLLVKPSPTEKPSTAPHKKQTRSAKPVQAKAATAQPSGRLGQPSLRESLLKVLEKSRRPLSARELGQQVLAGGYQTKSQDFTNVVWVALGKMSNVQNLPGQGWRLKRR